MTLFQEGFSQSEYTLPEIYIKNVISGFEAATDRLAYLDIIKTSHGIFSISSLGYFQFSLVLRSNHLKNYSFKLLDMGYDVSIYPVTIRVEEDIASECGYEKDIYTDESVVMCDDESALVQLLNQIFSTKKFISTVSGLMKIATSQQAADIGNES